MSRHTPGPWKVYKDENGINRIGTKREHPQLEGPIPIVSTMHSVDKGKCVYLEDKNAKLIATAPDMLEQLKKCEEFIENGVKCGMIELPSAPDPARDRLNKIKEVIAKAEGDIE